MTERFPGSEAVTLSGQEITAITSVFEKIAEQRRELAEKDPHELIFGITEDRALLSVDELYDVALSEDRFIVRYAPVRNLVNQEPLQEQRLPYTEVSRLRDGGTTKMPTRFGYVYCPAPRRLAPTTIDDKLIIPVAKLLPGLEAQ